MDNNDQKFIYGSLADITMVEQIVREMAKKGITVGHISDERGMHHLFVEKEEDLEFAIDYFRVKIGHPPKMEMPKEWEAIKKLPMGNLTITILGLCILIFGLGWLLKMPEVYSLLMFGPKEKGQAFQWIISGEFWRLLTPAFIHFGFLHVVFNLLWWKDLGNILENTKGTIFLGVFLVITGVLSNALQAYMVGANFGGLSGVVYALLGYLWIYKHCNPRAEYGLPKSDVLLMIGWFILCLFDVFSFGVANWAHGGGLISGMIIGGFYGYKDSKILSQNH